MKRILAIDRGKKRIGLAWKQSDLSMCFPIGYLDNDVSTGVDGRMLEQLLSVIEQKRITQIVIGKPFVSETASEGQRWVCGQIDMFAEVLIARLDDTIAVGFVDEHYSSVQAGAVLGDYTKHDGEDVVAAMRLLEELGQ